MEKVSGKPGWLDVGQQPKYGQISVFLTLFFSVPCHISPAAVSSNDTLTRIFTRRIKRHFQENRPDAVSVRSDSSSYARLREESLPSYVEFWNTNSRIFFHLEKYDSRSVATSVKKNTHRLGTVAFAHTDCTNLFLICFCETWLD